MRKVAEFYCDTQNFLDNNLPEHPEFVRHLGIYIEGDLLGQRGYFATYFPKAQEGRIFRKRLEGENLLERLTDAAREFANLEIKDPKNTGRNIKSKYQLIPISN